jgi:hypothetical protein
MAYVLVPCILAGGAEWVAHLINWIFFAAALVATSALALRIGSTPREARLASLLLAGVPSALAMAGTAMPVVLAMALGAWGIERVLAWRDEGRLSQAFAASALLAAAPLARPHLLLLLGVAALWSLSEPSRPASWHRTPPRIWVPLLCAPLLTGWVLLLTRDPLGAATDVGASARTFASLANLAANLVAYLAHWTLAIPLALIALALHPLSILRRPATWVAALLSVPLLVFAGGTRSLPLVALMAGLGAGALWDIFAEALTRRDRDAAALALWLLIPLSVAVYVHMPSKYLLASAPAAAVILARRLARAPGTRSRMVAGGAVVFGVLLGIAILRADAAFAGLGRKAARELIAPQLAAGKTVWFAGHWGFHWYAQRGGARPLSLTPPYPSPGDLAVSSLASLGQTILLFPERTLLATVSDATPGGRVMDKRAGAGFYSNSWGYFPWSWGNDIIDRIDLWRIDRGEPVIPAR